MHALTLRFNSVAANKDYYYQNDETEEAKTGDQTSRSR